MKRAYSVEKLVLDRGHLADSFPEKGGRIGDDGTSAGGATGVVLRVLA